MGDPAPARVSGPRTFVRQCPSTRIPLPSPAAAAACPTTSVPPALFGTRRAARCPVSGTTGFPRPARCVAPRSIRRHAGFPGNARFRDMRLSWPSVVPPPSARYRGYGGPCPAMRRPPTLQRCSMALGRHLRVTPSRRALPSRQRRTWRPIDAGHSSTASPRRHQLSSYRNACRYWPGDRFSAPSLPGTPLTAPRTRPLHCDFMRTVAGSDGARERGKLNVQIRLPSSRIHAEVSPVHRMQFLLDQLAQCIQ